MTFEQARWRLQLLAELGFGWEHRQGVRAEDARLRKLKEDTFGSG